MTTLLLKTKQNYFNGCSSSFVTGRRDRERDTGSVSENSDKLQGSIFVPSFQLKVPRTNCEQIALSSSSRVCEHVH